MEEKKSQRLVKISLIQHGPHSEMIGKDSKEAATEWLLKKVDEIAAKERPDFMMPTELATIPYCCGIRDVKYFDWAEPIPGPTTELFAEKAKKYEMVFLLPIYEKAKVEGVRYNSVVVLGPDGKIIEGVLPDGSRVHRYAKMHIPSVVMPNGQHIDERFYFDGGPGFPIFHTPKGKIAVYICYDRHFPEGWIAFALQGAEVIFNPACAMLLTPERGAASEAMYTSELQTMAMQNIVWICATNRVGVEEVGGGKLYFYGKSAIYHPTGAIAAQASSKEADVINQVIDLEETARMRGFWSFYRYRRPELYGLVTKSMV
jgi:beta-ureidopropionase